MWKQLSDWFKGQFTVASEVAQLRREVEALRRREESQAHSLEQLLFALQRESQQWRHEHANLLLPLRSNCSSSTAVCRSYVRAMTNPNCATELQRTSKPTPDVRV